MTKQRTSTVGYDHLPRRRLGLYASRMEDRFGNWVTYTYTNAASSPVRLSEINASDGRRITVAYNGSGFVQSVTANARTWSYGYSGGTAGSLTSVVLPDGSAWSIDLGTFQRLSIRYYQGEPGEQWRSCGQPGDIVPQTYVGRVTHPSGAVGQFTLEPRRFVRDGVTSYYPQNCALGNPDDSNDDSEWYPTAWDSYALISKNLTGPGLPAATWAYTYNSGYNTDVVGPGTYHRYTYGNVFRQNEAKLLKVEQGANATQILSIEDYTYELAQSGMPYPTPLGASPQIRSDDFTEEYPRPERQRVITRDGTTFSSYVNSFDAFVRPGSVGKWSSLGYGKTDVTEYHDDYGKWVIGQVKRQYNADTGIVMSQTDYGANALPWKTYAFGKLQQTLGYYADGTLATVTDGRNYTATLSNWYRGIPRTIQHPDGTIQSASVNDNGWITSVVDENGYSMGYGYDTMGRLASIVYPIGDAVAYQDTTSVFQQVGWDEYGIPAGHWRQTVTTGNARKVTYFDAMWRPLVQESYDQANVNATLSQSVKRYDASGKLAFQSYPLRFLSNYATVTAGTRTSYDPLDRVTRVEQDSELGVLATTTEYLSGFQTRVTNPRGLQTTNGYQAYDQPSTDLLRWSVQPEGKVIEVFRHAQLGQPTQLRQRNSDGSLQQSRYFVYDGYRQLCKIIEPEVGSTVMDYDAAGNVAWTASGHALPDTGSCNTAEGYWWGRRVDRSYDTRNRLTTLLFPDGRGNQNWSYTPDGLPAQITTYNDPGNGAPVVNAYTYNRRRLLTGESVSQTGWYTWGIGYGYDANGNLAGQNYPTGLYIDYAPNALGQARQVRDPAANVSYASNVSYHPNGGIAQFTYGNGIVHTMTQNARQLPARSTDSGGALDHEYQYDPAANVTYIGDLVQGAGYSRWMSYDGLDRLTAAGSASFGGDHWHRFTYDALDNLKSWKLAGVKDYANYYYEPGTNRLTNIQSSAGATVVGLGYDVQGNLANKNGKTYTFDYGNRLRGTNEEWYRYDGHGRRVLNWRATESGVLSQYSQSGQLLYDENHRASGRKASEHLYLAGSLVATRERHLDTGAWATKYQHTDALGSPAAVTNEVGQVIDRTAWEPYGAAIGKPAYDGIGYTGHVMDGATGLTYMQQRYYDPTIGRFLSVDPVTASTTDGSNFNRYKYANNNPYRFIDPDGRVDWDMLGDSFKLEGAVGLTLEAKVKVGPLKVSLGLGSATYGVGATLAPDAYAFQEVAGPSAALEFGPYGAGPRGSVERSYQGRNGQLYSEESKKGSGAFQFKRGELDIEQGGSNSELSGSVGLVVAKVTGSVDLGKAWKALTSPGGTGGGSKGGFQGAYRVEGRIDSKRLDKELKGK